MCGRARLPTDYSEIKIQLKLDLDGPPGPNMEPSWNIAPTQDMLCIVLDPKTRKRVSRKIHWGLIPKWAKSPKLEYPTFNAKAETIDEKVTFRGPWKNGQRCLVVTDGFYEWRSHRVLHDYHHRSELAACADPRPDARYPIGAGLAGLARGSVGDRSGVE